LNIVSSLHAEPASLVKHRAWCEARRCLLEAISAGPATVGLLGEAGTGKTWLLRAMGRELEAIGCRVTLLRQGDMPGQIGAGEALLIDEASRMDDGALAELLAQRRGVVILAALPAFAARLQRWAPPPAMVHLGPLQADEISAFAQAWAPHASEPAVTLTEFGLARLAVHSGGTARLITQLLNAVFALAALSSSRSVDGADVDQAAEFRLGGLVPEADHVLPFEAAVASAGPAFGVDEFWQQSTRARRGFRVGLAAAAVAACALGAWLAPASVWGPERTLKIAALEAIPVVAPAPPALVGAVGPALADRAGPALATVSAAALQPGVAPSLAEADAPSLAANAALPDLVGPASALAAAKPVIDDAWAEADFRAGRGGPGLILVARRGDTLRRLYADIYQGLRPPPFDDVVAANKRPFRPGEIVVFPAPPTGWAQN